MCVCVRMYNYCVHLCVCKHARAHTHVCGNPTETIKYPPSPQAAFTCKSIGLCSARIGTVSISASLHVCMCVRVRACMHACVHAYVHACVHACLWCVYVLACVRLCVHTCVQHASAANVRKCMRARARACLDSSTATAERQPSLRSVPHAALCDCSCAFSTARSWW